MLNLSGRPDTIPGGCWISPWAASILQNDENHIDGSIMDATFTVMNKYILAVLMAVSRNVGIPLAFAFGPRETVDRYNQFSEIFSTKFGINLRIYPLESTTDITFFQTLHTECLCGETRVLSAMYGKPFPCSHRLAVSY
jgi:hypothetical protein